MKKAICEGTINLGDLEIPCAVLEDETRLLTQQGFLKAIGRAPKAKGGEGASVDKSVAFLAAKNLKPFISEELEGSTRPIIFRTVKGVKAFGYKAELLPEVCSVYLEAKEQEVLHKSQLHIAKVCQILIRGLATVGITALVDEATGYQEIRSRKALEEILDRFITIELRKWAKTFPDDFYKELFRLRGWQYAPFSVKRPGVVGTWTNDLVYERLAPGVLNELRRLTPKDTKGRRKHKYFQRLTEDVGHPRLREHLAAVIALMRASTGWSQFHRAMQRALPRYGDTLELPLQEVPEEDAA